MLRDLVVVSGGWAWHLMSPAGHVELKHAHDMKDVDLFVAGRDVAALYGRLAELGHVRVSTRYDKRLDTPYEFHRYDGAGHGFFYWHRPLYRPEQAMDGWAKVFAFFGKHLAK